MKNDLCCYVCERPIERAFALFFIGENRDRVFIVHKGDCSMRIVTTGVTFICVRRESASEAV
jgi:hypothetical protein